MTADKQDSNRAVVSFVGGVFWLSNGLEKIQIPSEHTTSHSTLQEYVEENYDSVFYNFPAHLLSAEEPTGIKEKAINPSRVLSAPKPINNAPCLYLHKQQRQIEPKIYTCKHCQQQYTPDKTTQQYCSRTCGRQGFEKQKQQKPPQEYPSWSCTHCGAKIQRRIFPSAARVANKFCNKQCAYKYFREHPKTQHG